LAKFGKPYLDDMGKKLQKADNKKFLILLENNMQYTIYLGIAHFSTSLGKIGTIRKIWKFGGLPGIPC